MRVISQAFAPVRAMIEWCSAKIVNSTTLSTTSRHTAVLGGAGTRRRQP